MTEILPTSMMGVEITEPGGPDVLQAAQLALPSPEEGEVLIKTVAAGVNRPDVLQRLGGYPPPAGASPLPGLEVSGQIVAVGAGVPKGRIGEPVCALMPGGGYAEYAVTAEALCLPIPPGMAMVDAAGLPETFFTVWTNLFDSGRLSEGETVLIHGGTSGIGTTAIQVARAFGAKVITTAGSDEKCAFCEDLGAERTINYRREDFVETVRAHTEKKGVNLVLDMVGGDYMARNFDCLGLEGRYVSIAFLRGGSAEINFQKAMVKRQSWTGTTLRPRTVAQKAAIADALIANVWPRLADGSIKPIIHKTFALNQAAEAHRLMETSAHIGKILLVA